VSVPLILVASLLGLVVLLLAVPVGVAFQVKRIEAIQGHVTINWLFGLVRLHRRIPEVKNQPSQSHPDRRATGSRAKPAPSSRLRGVLAVLRRDAFRERACDFVRDLVLAAHVEDLLLRVRLGLGDPCDTGRLWALLGPVGALAQGLHDAEVRLEPEFLDAALEFEVCGRAVLVPLQILALAFGFLLSPVSLRAWRALVAGHG
jgi:hypothetical protein